MPLFAYNVLASAQQESFWFMRQGSSAAPQVDWLFGLIFYVSLFFFVLIVGLMVTFVVRYRRREGVPVEASPSHNTPLELVWMGIPVLIVIGFFYQGFKTYLDMRVAPANALEIQVTGKKWYWMYTYPQAGYDSVPLSDDQPAELHVPAGEPVKLVMTSEDVIHGFFIPAFRTKMDVVPGRYNTMWFTATQPGDHVIFCSVYCGTKHSMMRSVCVVHPTRADFDAWLKNAKEKLQSTLTPAERGRRLYFGKGGCSQCHSTDGRRIIGPTFKDLFGSERTFKDGTKAMADENYIRESINIPGAKIVAGYDNVMPVFQGRLKDKEIGDLIEYIKSFSSHYHPEGAQPVDTPAPAKKGGTDVK